MRRMILLGAVCFSATMLLAQTQNKPSSAEPPKTAKVVPLNVPLNAKTGLWQMTQTVTWTGLPPQMASAMNRTTTYKSCITTKDLSTNPWSNGSHDNCTWTVLHSTGRDMEVKGTSCDLGKDYGMKADVHGTIHLSDSENGTGTMAVTLTGNGQTMNGNASYTGKWIGASCSK